MKHTWVLFGVLSFFVLFFFLLLLPSVVSPCEILMSASSVTEEEMAFQHVETSPYPLLTVLKYYFTHGMC